MQAENQSRIANVDRLEENQRLMLKSTVELGQNALKYAIIINGGAAVAMLAFIGNILSKGLSVNGSLIWSLVLFAIGVLTAAVSSGAAYLSQAYFSLSFGKQKNMLVDALNNGNNGKNCTADFDSGYYGKYGTLWRTVAISIAFFGYFLFAVGVITSYYGLKV